jgi:hypothetical protein
MNTLIPDIQNELGTYLTVHELTYQVYYDQTDPELTEAVVTPKFWSYMFMVYLDKWETPSRKERAKMIRDRVVQFRYTSMEKICK